MSQFVFLISNGRSGSSLVHEILARHPEVGFVSNLEDRIPSLPPSAGRYNNLLYRRMPPSLTQKGRLRFAPSEAYRILTRQVSAMIADSVRDLEASDAMPWVARRFESFFGERAAVQDKSVFLHKFTGWPRTGFIRAIMPDARFIHIVRDGRAVVTSTLRSFWGWPGYRGVHHLHTPLPPSYEAEWEASGRSFALLSGLEWKTRMDLFAGARAAVPAGQWADYRFEDILAEPDRYLKLMLEFMGLEQDRRFDDSLAKIKLVPGQRDAFRRDLDGRSLALLDDSLGDHLDAWGYSRR